MKMWEIENGILRIGVAYLGKNGRKCCMKEGLEPFTDDEIKSGTLIVDDYPGEKIRIDGDWVILERIRLAYHKNGSIAFLEDSLDVSGVDPNYPLAIKTEYGIDYRFYMKIEKDNTIISKFPIEGGTFIESNNPEEAIEVAKIFYEYTGVQPYTASDAGANLKDREFPYFYDGKFVLDHYPKIAISVDNLKPDEIRIDEKYKTVDYNDRVSIEYSCGVPIMAFYNKNGISATIVRKDEPTEKFIEKIKILASLEPVPGRAPYRAEVSHWKYYAWVKIGDEIVEFELPYGITLKGAEFVRGKCKYKPDGERALQIARLFKAMGKDVKVVRSFTIAYPLLKVDDDYYLGETYIGSAKDPHEALKKFNEMRKKNKNAIGDDEEEDEYDELDVIRVCIGDPDDDLSSCYEFRYTPENLNKIRTILNEVRDLYSTVEIRAANDPRAGLGFVPKIIKGKIEPFAKLVETLAPGVTWEITDDGSFEIVTKLFFDMDSGILKVIYDNLPRFESPEDYFERRIRESGIKQLKKKYRETITLP